MSIVDVKGLGKTYRSYKNIWLRLAHWFGLPVKPEQETWVLRHINFDIHPGQAIGIIGQNGAGKSTLLKLLSRTLHPTEGTIHINGRVSAILELGMGFNPDLTGRQNVYHSAGLMGFSQEQIDAVISDIEAFSEIGEYFDQPVRVYSSGMQVRVAFAVATAWRPEVLIIDEALSVGDNYFQHKSFDRIRAFQQQGTSLLLVSHDRSAIQALCSRALLLEKGTILKDDTPEVVFDFYNALIATKESEMPQQQHLENGGVQTKSGTGEATIENISLLNANAERCEQIGVGDEVELCILVRVHAHIDNLVIGIGIKDRLGQVMFGINTWHTKQVIKNAKKGKLYQVSITFKANFGVGSYSVQAALHDSDTHLAKNYEWLDYALMFEVINESKNFFVGTQWLDTKITINQQ